jgi:collagenase-like PrtC family protease
MGSMGSMGSMNGNTYDTENTISNGSRQVYLSVFHHKAFKTTENELLGAAIKYATSKGKNVEIISDLYPNNLLIEKLNNSEDFIKKDGTSKNQAIVITKN